MIIYMDIDGTLTTRQRGNSFFKYPLRTDVIEKVKQLQAQGHEIVLWTGSTRYAQRVMDASGIHAVAAVEKPSLIVDNQVRRWRHRLADRIITPEEFLLRDFARS